MNLIILFCTSLVPKGFPARLTGSIERRGQEQHDISNQPTTVNRELAPFRDDVRPPVEMPRLYDPVTNAARTKKAFRLVIPSSQEFDEVLRGFQVNWLDFCDAPPVSYVFAISNSYLQGKWEEYRKTLHHHHQDSRKYYHGTKLACNITASQTFCTNLFCGICGISCSGLDSQYIGINLRSLQFGTGFYLSPDSSYCHKYTEGVDMYRAMLLCDVLPGKEYIESTKGRSLHGPPPGYDSIYGSSGKGSTLDYSEAVVYKSQAVLPRYIIVYQKDGIDRITI